MTQALPAFFRLERLGRISSTNDAAKALAIAGAPEGTLVTAEEQTGGRGRERREWISPKGNLYASLVLRPLCGIGVAAQLGFAAALGVFDAAEAVLLGKPPLALKWPNDVLLGGAKLAGILIESEASGETRLDWLVLGIGVNLAAAPAGTELPATALAAWGAEVTPDDFLPILAVRFLAWYEAWGRDGFAALRAAWLSRAHAPGAPIRVRRGGREERGRFGGLDAEGRLLFDGPSGCVTIAAADVFPAVP